MKSILFALTVTTFIVNGDQSQEYEPQYCFPPIAEYIEYWSGKRLYERDLAEKSGMLLRLK